MFVKGDVASGCKLLRNRFESKDREWASYTCVLGFHVMGERKAFKTFFSFVILAKSIINITTAKRRAGAPWNVLDYLMC